MKSYLIPFILMAFLSIYPAAADEDVEEAEGGYQVLVIGVLLGFVLGVLSSYAYLLRKKVSVQKKSEEIYLSVPGLTETENKVFLVLIREKGRVYQDRLPNLTGLSRARVSEVLSSLEKKGIIKKESRGRTNLVRLTRDISHRKE
jgi:uncharacterized membrane protein